MTDGPDGAVATALELSLQELIYAGLDALRTGRDGIELAAYLHASGGTGPQLFLAAPTLESLRPNQAFDLFIALRDALQRPDAAGLDGGAEGGESVEDLGGFHALTVVTAGPSSRGLHAVGRRSAPMTGADRAVLAPLARTLGRVNHRLEEVTHSLAT